MKTRNSPLLIIIFLIIFSFKSSAQNFFYKGFALDTLLKIAENPPHDSIYFYVHVQLGAIYRNISSDSSKIHLDKAYQMAKKLNEPNFLSICRYIQAITAYKTYESKLALSYLAESESWFKKLDNENYLREVINLRGLINWRLGNLDEAVTNFKSLQTYADTSNDKHWRMASRINISLIYTDMNMDEKAIVYLKEALVYSEELKDNRATSLILNNLSIKYRHKGDYDLSNKYLEKALILAKQNNNLEQISRIHSNFGANYSRENLFEKSLEHLKIAYDINKKIGVSAKNVKVTWHIGETYMFYEKYAKAKQWVDSSLKLAYQNGSPVEIRYAHELIKDIAHKEGDIDLAVARFDSISFWEDSLTKITYNTKMAEAEKKYEVNKLKYDFDLAEKEKILLTQQKQRQKWWFIISSLLLSLCFLAFYLFRKLKHKKNLIELNNLQSIKIMEAQEMERERISRELHDNIGQNLLIVKNQVQLNKISDRTTEIIENTLENVRSLSRDLHPYQIEHLGFSGAILNLIDDIESTSTITFSEKLDVNAEKLLTKTQQFHFYRITQELFSNITKHSNANSVLIQLHKTEKHIILSVKDNGKGMDVLSDFKKVDSLGLKSIRDRVNILNGELKIESKKNDGVFVQVSVLISTPFRNISTNAQ